MQANHSPPSTWHSERASGSSAVKDTVASGPMATSIGALWIVDFGALVSIVNERVAGVASVLPAASVARTANVWPPSGSVSVIGLEHAVQVPPSTRHSNVEPDSLAVNVNVGDPSLVLPLGPPVIDVFGAVVSAGGAGVVSTVNERVAGVASTLPAASMARTENVWAPSASEL